MPTPYRLAAALPAAVALLVMVLAACTAAAPLPAPAAAQWREVALPVPAGWPGRLAVRDAATCAGSWYVAGGVVAADGASRPAAWRSADGVSWTPLPFDPQTFWGAQDVLYSVGCRDGAVAFVGAKSGGAHGNPRVSTWYARPDGAYVEAPAAFELYGGPHAVNVGRLASGPNGWLIVGNRTFGAAVWRSPDATEFQLLDDDPQLVSDDRVDTAALDAVYAGGWTLVGNGALTGRVPRIPLAWTSEDGAHWQRQPLTYTDEYSDLQRVIRHGDGLVAAGARGASFAAWRRVDGSWQPAGRFGSTAGHGSSFVSGLAAAAGGLFATATDGDRYSLWTSADGEGWRQVQVPASPTSGGDRAMTVAGSGSGVLLLADDGLAGRAWLCADCRATVSG